MRQRTIVCPLIQNDGAYLLCKMADDRGVFPGQWALSGGGVEPGERIEEALRREIREELGWICPYISRHLLSLNPLLACCRRYSRGER